ncbi:MAG: hypothetical protein CFK52_13530 [Chloracidobacterium sp. CP2_5A]|nr:MAG: hypothetical protein CFK52_13530 [Chloracidobacterium sp. CP2_5A]
MFMARARYWIGVSLPRASHLTTPCSNVTSSLMPCLLRALAAPCLVSALLLGGSGQAQTAERLRDEPTPRRSDPSAVGRWLVIVTHHVTLGELTAVVEDAALSAVLDGACAPTDVVLTNVTTGIVVDAQGHVLTELVNLPPGHANPSIMVQTQDRQEFRAKFVGRDGATGMCILRVPGLTIAPPPMHSLAPAKGPPPTVGASVSARSAVRIMLPMFQPLPDRAARSRMESAATQLVWDEIVANQMPETPLSPPVATSFGVAVDSQNRLVAVVQPRGNQMRLLPVADVQRAISRIIAAGRSVPHGWLGIEGKTLATLSADDRARLGARAAQGVAVTAVMPGSPAEEAGLLPGDIILRADARPLESRRELNEVVVSHAAGEILSLVVERAGKERVCRVTLGSPEEVPALKPPMAEHLAIGLVSSDLTAQLAKFFGVANGVLVTHVLPDSPAAAAGVRSGDIIVAVGSQSIQRGEDLPAALLHAAGQSPGTPVKVEVIRERQARRLLLSLPAPPPNL